MRRLATLAGKWAKIAKEQEEEEGQAVVLDNLSAHKGEKVRELVEARGC